MCEERPEIVTIEGLEASHPRVAGIVQTHRQQVDTAQMGRQAVRTRDIKENKVPAARGRCQVFASPNLRIASMIHSHGLGASVLNTGVRSVSRISRRVRRDR